MTHWTTEAVLDRVAEIRTVPDSATLVRTDEAPFYLDGDTAGILEVTAGPPDSVAKKVRDIVGTHGARRLFWSVLPDGREPALERALIDLGATVVQRTELSAYDLTTGLPAISVPEDVTVIRVDTEHDRRDVVVTNLLGWGRPQPSPDEVARHAAALRGDQFLARHDGTSVGTAGLELSVDLAGLVAGAVLPEYRGRGIYRALLDARLRYGIAGGATLAVVLAVPDTSAPILRRLGFTVYGEQHVLELTTT